MTHVYDNWGLSSNGNVMLIETIFEEMKSTEPVCATMLGIKGGVRLDFLNASKLPVMYLWCSKLLVTGLWNYGKSQLPPLIRVDGGNTPNVFLKDDPSKILSQSSWRNISQCQGAMIEHTNRETNEVLSTIASGLDKEICIQEWYQFSEPA